MLVVCVLIIDVGVVGVVANVGGIAGVMLHISVRQSTACVMWAVLAVPAVLQERLGLLRFQDRVLVLIGVRHKDLRAYIRFGSVRFGSVRFGSVSIRFGSVRFGFCSVLFDSVRFGSVPCSCRFDALRCSVVRDEPSQ